MIRFVKGTVVAIEENYLILDHQGIGFRIFTPSSILERYVRVGEEIKLHLQDGYANASIIETEKE